MKKYVGLASALALMVLGVIGPVTSARADDEQSTAAVSAAADKNSSTAAPEEVKAEPAAVERKAEPAVESTKKADSPAEETKPAPAPAKTAEPVKAAEPVVDEPTEAVEPKAEQSGAETVAPVEDATQAVTRPEPGPAEANPERYLATSFTKQCGSATITLRNVSPWIYPVSTEIDGVASYGPTVDNRTNGGLSGPVKDQSVTRTISFPEDTGDHTVRYRVAAGSESDLYKGLPVGEWTTFTVSSNCLPDNPCSANYLPKDKMWEITWGKQFSDTNGVSTFKMGSYGGLVRLNGGPVPSYMTAEPNWHWLYVTPGDVARGRVVTYGFRDKTIITATVSGTAAGCPSVAWVTSSSVQPDPKRDKAVTESCRANDSGGFTTTLTHQNYVWAEWQWVPEENTTTDSVTFKPYTDEEFFEAGCGGSPLPDSVKVDLDYWAGTPECTSLSIFQTRNVITTATRQVWDFSARKYVEESISVNTIETAEEATVMDDETFALQCAGDMPVKAPFVVVGEYSSAALTCDAQTAILTRTITTTGYSYLWNLKARSWFETVTVSEAIDPVTTTATMTAEEIEACLPVAVDAAYDSGNDAGPTHAPAAEKLAYTGGFSEGVLALGLMATVGGVLLRRRFR